MKDVMGIFNLVNEIDQLEELTYERCIASVPFGGRYRLIDFVLSSMVNSGISNVAVFTHKKYRSLMDHLGSGKGWDLNRKRNGLFILPPAIDEYKEMLKGDLYNISRHRDYFHRSTQEYVIISHGHMVCNIDFREVVESHKISGADITLVFKETDNEAHAKTRKITINHCGRVIEMQDYDGHLQSNRVSMDIFVLKKELLLDLVETTIAQGYDHFVRYGIMRNIERLHIQGYEYKGYLGIINTIQSYYHNSMNLLNPDVWKQLFYVPGLIYTKIKDEPPTKYTRDALVRNCLIANGCIIQGNAEGCIIFRGVRIHKGVHLRNSIVLQNCEIRENVAMENAILDKDVVVNANKQLKGDPAVPYIVAKQRMI